MPSVNISIVAIRATGKSNARHAGTTFPTSRERPMYIEPEDDGFVLIQGKLWKPEDVTRAAAEKFKHNDGRAPRSAIRRYADCYPHPDATTPTSQHFKVHR